MPRSTDKLLIVICGPTASGKTEISLELARRLNTEIISCDSRQFYREIPIGTAAPDRETTATIPHHFVGNKSICEEYSAGKFEKEAIPVITKLFRTKDILIMTGGSGLYIDAICNGFDDVPRSDHGIREELNEIYRQKGIEVLLEELEEVDPDYFFTVDRNNPQRIIRALEICRTTPKSYTEYRKGKKKKRPFRILKFCIDMPREILYDRINRRTEFMMDNGLIEEARSVWKYKNYNSLQTVGFKELFDYFDGATDLTTAIELIKRNTRRYAKRQMTWFRKDKDIIWIQNIDEIIFYLKKSGL
ncbi:MAG: tRNA (adenosine(37)-N6)-dimethylallyltransferase MiaA [Rikenellaceae bacterium]|nr:tRNA (adenosine(37)-N6)-dimethylallyltransferase MiaA [Rikenellaceae bacterium]